MACEQVLGFERGYRRADPHGRGGDAGAGRGGAGGEEPETVAGGGDAGATFAHEAGTTGSSGASNTGGAPNTAGAGAATTAGNANTGGESNTGGEHAGCSEDDDCSNPEPAHCRISCVRTAVRGTCRVSARDADGDRHGSAACQQHPGDDCDDALESVNPTAGEVCDGIDNDCDGSLDLTEGLELAGSTLALASEDDPRYPTIAFAPASAVFGAIWQEGKSGEDRLMFSLVSPDGAGPAAPVVVNEQPGVQNAVLAAAGDAFAVAWIDGASQVHIRFITSDAVLESKSVQMTDGTAESSNLALTPVEGGWAAFWSSLNVGMQGRKFTAGGLGRTVTFDGAPNIGGADAALLEDRILLLWPTTGGVDHAAFLDDSLALISATPLYGIGNVVAAGPTSFGLAGTKNDLSFFTSLNADGTPICGPVALPLDHYPADIAPSARGFVIVAGFRDVQLVEVRSDCTIVQHATVLTFDGTGASSTLPCIASAADRGFGLVWVERWYPGALGSRFFGPAYCD